MLYWMKAAAPTSFALVLVMGLPADSSAFFPWLYDAVCCPPAYSTGYYVPFTAFYAPAYPPGYPASGWLADGGDCSCLPTCLPCGNCLPCTVGSPCGAGGCPSGGCGVGPTPANTSPSPKPEPDSTTPPSAPAPRPPRRTFDPDADSPSYEPPVPRDSGTSRTRSRTLPADDFERRTPSRSEPTGTPMGAGVGTGTSPESSDNSGFGDDPNLFPTPGSTRKPSINPSQETVIPARKPAEAVPLEETPNNQVPELDGRNTTRPVIEKQRLVLRNRSFNVSVERPQEPAKVIWSGIETHVARQ